MLVKVTALKDVVVSDESTITCPICGGCKYSLSKIIRNDMGINCKCCGALINVYDKTVNDMLTEMLNSGNRNGLTLRQFDAAYDRIVGGKTFSEIANKYGYGQVCASQHFRSALRKLKRIIHSDN